MFRIQPSQLGNDVTVMVRGEFMRKFDKQSAAQVCITYAINCVYMICVCLIALSVEILLNSFTCMFTSDKNISNMCGILYHEFTQCHFYVVICGIRLAN